MAGMTGNEGTSILVIPTGDDRGFEIVDTIERRRCRIKTDDPVTPNRGDPQSFPFPVETAVSFTASAVEISATAHVYVRNAGGELLTEFRDGSLSLDPDSEIYLDLPGLIQVYLRCQKAFSVTKTGENPRITFDAPATVEIGCRSLHSRPAATVETPAEPGAIARAISTFGSALKTTDPARSFPTHRGHPPALKRADELAVPDGLSAPRDDVRIEVPPVLGQLFTVGSLAYYLGVPVRVGDEPRIVGPNFSHTLDGSGDVGREVSRLLKQVFVLDCAVRTEGRYPVDLRLRDRVTERVDVPLETLYDLEPAGRLARYLEIPYAEIKDLVPRWRLTAHVAPTPDRLEVLPYLADDLAAIHTSEAAAAADGGTKPMPSAGSVNQATPTHGIAGAGSDWLAGDRLEEVWLAPGEIDGATKGQLTAFVEGVDRSPQDGPIEILVVSNATDLVAEGDVVDEVYGCRTDLPFEVTVRREVDVGTLRELLAADHHFFHYVGHIDSGGIRCTDGHLDVRTVEAIGAEAFFLNACRSNGQGLALIEGGSLGGIVTRSEIVDHGAVRIGRTVARLLNYGFPLRAALEVARGQSVMGGEYTIVGDGTLAVVQPPSGLSQLYLVEETADGYRLHIEGLGAQPGPGCMWIPYVPGNAQHYLAGSRTDAFGLDHAELTEFLGLESAPLMVDERLTWSDEWTPVPDA